MMIKLQMFTKKIIYKEIQNVGYDHTYLAVISLNSAQERLKLLPARVFKRV